jgi:hypothetical protein
LKDLSASFASPVHSERVAAWLGLALGITFTTCFVTGLYSHFAQHPSWGFQLPARPAGLYRFTQGLHVVCGIASIPLLFAKLWSVFPQLFQWPPFRGVAHTIERLFIIPLVAGSIFLLFTGLANIHLWYPWRFNFPDTHFRAAWVTMGALAVHIGAKWTTTSRALAREAADAGTSPAERLDRRRFLGTAFGASALVALFSVGETFRPLARLALLSPRRPDTGTQGFPVNATAKEAGVLQLAQSPAYRLAVEGNVAVPLSFTLDELRALPQHSATLPISCVEGWSASRRWTGVQLREILSRAGAPKNARVRIESFQRNGINLTSEVDRAQAHDPDTLLALQVNGESLALDHGYPCRLIGPDRPGVLQTKWVGKVVVL